jgi:hypothetical protein
MSKERAFTNSHYAQMLMSNEKYDKGTGMDGKVYERSSG